MAPMSRVLALKPHLKLFETDVDSFESMELNSVDLCSRMRELLTQLLLSLSLQLKTIVLVAVLEMWL